MSQPSAGAAPAGGSGDMVNGLASFELMRMIHGDWLSHLIFCACKLKLPDLLQTHGALTTAELAAKVSVPAVEADALLNRKKGADSAKLKPIEGVNTDVLDAVLKCLRMMKIFDSTEDGKWKNGPLGPLLTVSHPASVRSWAVLNGELYGKMWSHLLTTLVSGEPATRTVLGGNDFYAALDDYPQLSSLFDSAMNDMSRAAAVNIPKNLPPQLWFGVKKIVDIGGGNGGFMRALMRAIVVGKQMVIAHKAAAAAAAAPPASAANTGDQPAASAPAPAGPPAGPLPPLAGELTKYGMSAVVLDRHSTCDSARQLPENTVLGSHLQFHGADLYEALPAAAAGADWYIIKNVLHDYSFATSAKILANVKAVMLQEPADAAEKKADKAPLLIIERLVEEDEKNPGLVLDAVFQRLKGETGTVDRNETEFKKLLEHSGFKWSATIRLPTTHAVIIAYPA